MNGKLSSVSGKGSFGKPPVKLIMEVEGEFDLEVGVNFNFVALPLGRFQRALLLLIDSSLAFIIGWDGH